MAIIQTKYGRVAEPDGRCKDDYAIIELLHRDGMTIKLQEGAMGSYREACRAYARKTWPDRYHAGKVKYRPIMLTGSWRSCAYQRQLWESDPQRFAHPDVTLHPRGLAIDVATPVPVMVHNILLNHGWHQSRPGDEPWHFSYCFTA